MNEEDRRLLRENNEMLKKVCGFIDYIMSSKHQMDEEQRNLMTNLFANLILGFGRC